MIYLILKIFVYLLLALAGGFGAGWLTRNLQSLKKEEGLQRALTDARAKLPQFESLLRTRDEQLKSLKAEMKDKDKRLADLRVEVAELEKRLKTKDRELRRYQPKEGAEGGDELELTEVDLGGVAVGGGAPGDEARISELEAECARLRAELDAAEASGSGERSGSTSALEEVLRTEVEELEARLRQTATEHDRLSQTLKQEQRKVVELERERDLQNRSLQVLHQQLEVERERSGRAANG